MRAKTLLASMCLALAWTHTDAVAGPCLCNGNADNVGTVDPNDIDLIFTCLDGDCTGCANDCDVNCDGVVDLEDVSVAQCQLGTNDPTCCAAITTGACCIDGITCAQATQAVCLASADARYLGDGTICADGGCDCNGNGVNDRLDIANNFEDDCNRNGIPDRCEINVVSPAPGGPFFCNIPGNCDPDCNNNGQPDGCDIERCGAGIPANPDCQDCNLNRIPDICDISMGVSNDFNGDFTPDECRFWDGGGGNDLWGNPQNWNPDTLPQPNDPVTIAGPTSIVQLDIPVQIRSLSLIDRASLIVSSPLPNDLQILDGLDVRGNLRLGRDRQVIVMNGDAVIGSSGSLKRDGVDPTTAALRVLNGNLKVLEGIATQPRGELVLEDRMELSVSGDVVVDGRNAVSCDLIPLVGPDCTPPLLELTKNSKAEIFGKMELKGSVEIKGGKLVASAASAPSGSSGPSAAGPPDHQIVLGGDFQNKATDPQCFDFIDGGIRLDSTIPPFANFGEGLPQDFEVAGADIGPVFAGLDNNFAFGQITITTPTRVNFVDRFDNDGNPSRRDAQYVQVLRLDPGTRTNTVGVNVYYVDLIDGGSVITGNGALIPIVGPAVPAASGFAMFVLASCMILAAARIMRKQRFEPQT